MQSQAVPHLRQFHELALLLMEEECFSAPRALNFIESRFDRKLDAAERRLLIVLLAHSRPASREAEEESFSEDWCHFEDCFVFKALRLFTWCYFSLAPTLLVSRRPYLKSWRRPQNKFTHLVCVPLRV